MLIVTDMGAPDVEARARFLADDDVAICAAVDLFLSRFLIEPCLMSDENGYSSVIDMGA